MLSTKTKIRIARILTTGIVGIRSTSGRGPIVHALRHGVKWRLDLNEGIDLAIYLGLYQRIPQRVINAWIRPGSLVLDIGANIGSHCLPLARLVGAEGRVIAVEPTDYAFSKLSANTKLNPDIQNLILVQAALGDGSTEKATLEFYSRWPLHGEVSGRHEKHLGQLESAHNARLVCLDALLDELRSKGSINGPVKFVKLDVDGHELAVLDGGRRTFTTDKPAILIEIAPHVQDEVPGRFEALVQKCSAFGYCLETAESGRLLPMSATSLRQLVSRGASIDALARAEPPQD